jgi:hypothetical protein
LIAIVACGEKKSPYPVKARYMYQGSYHKLCLNYALTLTARVYILSAKYGLLDLSEIIEPYNVKMDDKNSVKIDFIRQQAEELNLLNEKVIVLGGSEYVKICSKIWKEIETPLKGKGGLLQQLKWLNQQLKSELF